MADESLRIVLDDPAGVAGPCNTDSTTTNMASTTSWFLIATSIEENLGKETDAKVFVNSSAGATQTCSKVLTDDGAWPLYVGITPPTSGFTDHFKGFIYEFSLKQEASTGDDRWLGIAMGCDISDGCAGNCPATDVCLWSVGFT